MLLVKNENKKYTMKLESVENILKRKKQECKLVLKVVNEVRK